MVPVMLGELVVPLRVELAEQKHVPLQHHRNAVALQRRQLSPVPAIHLLMASVLLGEIVVCLVEAEHKHA